MPSKRDNVIMLLLDGSRCDRLPVSPELINITKSGSFFDQCIISSPYTVASVHSILTGIYGSKNGVNSYNNMFGLRNDVKTLTEYLKENDYYTVGDVHNKAVLSSRGFDKLSIHDEYSVDMVGHHKNIINNASKSGNPFFLFLQYSKLHTDSVSKVAKKFDDLDSSFFTKSQRKINESNFDKSMKDAGIYSEEILKYLHELELIDDTILIIFSDHGTSLGEKFGEKMYGSFTYDYTVKSYVVFINDKFPSKVVQKQVRSIDIMPTILDVLGIVSDKSFKDMDGESLLPLISSPWNKALSNFFLRKQDERIAYVETGGLGGPWPSPNEPNVRAVRTNEWKLIHNMEPGEWELYNLISDPDEEVNLFGTNKKVEEKLMKALNSFN